MTPASFQSFLILLGRIGSFLSLLFAAPLFLSSNELGAGMQHFLRLYTVFLCLIFCWQLILDCARDIALCEGRPELAQRKKSLLYLLVFLILLLLLPVTYLREYIANELFWGVLCTLSAGALSIPFFRKSLSWKTVQTDDGQEYRRPVFRRGYSQVDFGLQLTYFFGIAYLNFSFFLGYYHWQPALVALSLALASILAHSFASPSQRWYPLLFGSAERASARSPFLVLLCVFSLATLVYFSQLPKHYLLILATGIIPLSFGQFPAPDALVEKTCTWRETLVLGFPCLYLLTLGLLRLSV